MLCHIRVNAIAHYYQISQLKALANTKFQSILEEEWSAKSFLAAIQEVPIEVLETDNDALLEIITQKTASHIEELIELDAYATPIIKHIASNIMKVEIARHKDINDDLSLSLQSAEEALGHSEIEVRTLENMIELRQSQLQDMREEVTDKQIELQASQNEAEAANQATRERHGRA